MKSGPNDLLDCSLRIAKSKSFSLILEVLMHLTATITGHYEAIITYVLLYLVNLTLQGYQPQK